MFWFYVFEISVTEISASVPVQCRWMRCYLRCSQHWKVTWIKQQQKLLCPGSMPVIVIIHRTLIRTTSVTESRSSKNLRDRRNIKKKTLQYLHGWKPQKYVRKYLFLGIRSSISNWNGQWHNLLPDHPWLSPPYSRHRDISFMLQCRSAALLD